MSAFSTQTAAASTVAPDVHKHVKYSIGMVLGADDFDQEFAYLANRDQWQARDTIGYGTVCGLRVRRETDADSRLRIVVEPGVALNPRGELIRVSAAQAAYLNDWLVAHRSELVDRLGSPPTDLVTLYVVLCYRECPTDRVPIPGEPCRDETEATVASRLEDDYTLSLSLTRPNQGEETAVRDFVHWLSQIEISDSAVSVDLEVFLEAVRNALHEVLSPPGSPLDLEPEIVFGSPPAGWAINTQDACKYLRVALRVWVTEVRPKWRGTNCDGSPPHERCVLLAALEMPLLDGQVTNVESVAINEDDRPFVVHLRMLQELITCGPRGGGAGLSPASMVVPENVLNDFAQPASVGVMVDEYALADHTHGVPADPVPAHQLDLAGHQLAGDATGSIGATRVERLQGVDLSPAPPAKGQVLTYDGAQWSPTTPKLDGDAKGDADTNKVVGIQGVPVNATPPTDGQVLKYVAGTQKWTPTTLSGGPATGDFVEHPAGLPRYFIVAAGILSTVASRQPIYNDLKFVGFVGPGQIGYTFGNYAPPQPNTHQYIVKAIPVFNERFAQATRGMVSVSFVEFLRDRFVLRLTDDAGDALNNEKDTLLVELMIEVSAYAAPPAVGPGRPRLNLNAASVEEIDRAVPRVGPAIARRIVATRDRLGGFQTLNDLLEVQGISQDILRVIEPFVSL